VKQIYLDYNASTPIDPRVRAIMDQAMGEAFGNPSSPHWAGAPARDLVYLPDVARLEWAWHEAFHATDAVPLGAEALAAIPMDALPRLTLTLHPSVRLVQSDYPVAAIWRANQPDRTDPPRIDACAGGERVLVIRPAADVDVRTLSPGAHWLLSSLGDGETLADAFAAAAAAEPDVGLERVMGELIAAGAFAGHSFDG